MNEKIKRWLTFYVLLCNNGGGGIGNRSVLFEVPKTRLGVVEAGKSSSEGLNYYWVHLVVERIQINIGKKSFQNLKRRKLRLTIANIRVT